MKIPFRHAGHRGQVRVSFGRSRGSIESGFDHLGATYGAFNSAGFPTMRASLSYDGKGYRRFFGWIQIVDHDFGAGGRLVSVVDVPPSLIGFGVPFVALGECPVLYDSPATTVRRPGAFSAETFLCAVSIVDRKTPIRPLAAFGWGYELDASLAVRRRAPTPLAKEAWVRRVPLLKRTCPRWAYTSRP